LLANRHADESIYQSDGLCHDFCLPGGNAFAVVQGHGCFCSNILPDISSQVDVGRCSAPCPGYQTDVCGGDGLWGYMALGPSPSATAGASSSPSSSASSSPSTISTSSSSSSVSFPRYRPCPRNLVSLLLAFFLRLLRVWISSKETAVLYLLVQEVFCAGNQAQKSSAK
jgi:hypothetical protein